MFKLNAEVVERGRMVARRAVGRNFILWNFSWWFEVRVFFSIGLLYIYIVIYSGGGDILVGS
jgi:hypothetical protein